jgi:hypothetical protein
MKKPADQLGRARHSHKSKTRISAIVDFARKGKREKKALPLFPLTARRHDDPGRSEKNFASLSHAIAD